MRVISTRTCPERIATATIFTRYISSIKYYDIIITSISSCERNLK